MILASAQERLVTLALARQGGRKIQESPGQRDQQVWASQPKAQACVRGEGWCGGSQPVVAVALGVRGMGTPKLGLLLGGCRAKRQKEELLAASKAPAGALS